MAWGSIVQFQLREFDARHLEMANANANENTRIEASKTHWKRRSLDQYDHKH